MFSGGLKTSPDQLFANWSPHATPEDVIACYRLLLGRTPDEGGLRAFNAFVAAREHSPLELAQLFYNSPEAIALRARLAAESTEIQTIEIDRFKIRVMPNWNGINSEIALTHNYEPHLRSNMEPFFKKGRVFADIGANVGFFSLLAASHGCDVFSFEPHSRNAWLLHQSSLLNKFKIQLFPVALADQSKLIVYNQVDGNGQVSEINENLPAIGQEVLRAQSLDSLLNQKPDVIKIDVEGFEAIVMAGATRALEAKPTVFSEFSPAGLETISRVSGADYLQIFVSRGYQLFHIHQDASREHCSAAELVSRGQESQTGFIDIMATPA
jgi:FkbM family methyltransferase